MYDAASRSEIVAHQRAVGALLVELRARDGATVLERLRQEGCLKARFPRPHATGWVDAVSLNTSGGVAGGDRLDLVFWVKEGARGSISTQAAERFYRALPGSAPAHLRSVVRVDDAAWAEWLPQETILYDGCALDRALDIHLVGTGRVTGLETLVFGRDAMGERVRGAAIADRIRIHRDGVVILHDSTRLIGEVDAKLSRKAMAGGARAVAVLFHVGPDAAEMLEPVRAALAGVEAGVSAWDGMLVARLLGPSSAAVRGAAMAALHVLRAGRVLPRVWQC